jgi:hypothetical protein
MRHMIKTLFYLSRMLGKLARFLFRVVSGQNLRGQRKTDATFWRPATRSLDPSGTALRWEMQRGAARAAWRIAGAYVFLLSGVLLLLWGVGSIFSLPEMLRPGRILLLHLVLLGVFLLLYVTHRGNLEHGYSLPYPAREEVLRTQEQIDDLLEVGQEEMLLKSEQGEKRWVLRWYRKEGRLLWEKEKVLPLATALAPMLNMHMTPARARRMVTVPRGYRTPGSKIEILLPLSFTGADSGVQKRVVSTVRSKLGIKEELEEQWQLEGSTPRLLLSAPPAPPEKVFFSDVEHFLLASEEYNPFIGIIGGGEGMNVSLKADSPHIAVSAGSGAGKSVLLKLLAMQFRRMGWNIIVLDWKEESHDWIKGLPGVRYCTSIQQIHDMCVMLGDEVETRKSNPDAPRPKIFIISEEWNITAPLLAEYWEELRQQAEPEDRRHMPRRSPALTGRMKVNFTGRQLGLCDGFVAQRFSARVTNGNADMRESFQVLFMARWKEQTKKMLAGGIKPFPKKPKEVGRWVVIVGDDAFTVQVPLVTDEEARAFAMGGEEAPLSPWVMLNGAGGSNGGNGAAVDQEQGFSLPSGATGGNGAPVPEILRNPMKLSELAESLAHLKVTKKVLQKAALAPASGGDEHFPPVIGGTPTRGYLYDLHAVKQWAIERNAARAAERAVRS